MITMSIDSASRWYLGELKNLHGQLVRLLGLWGTLMALSTIAMMIGILYVIISYRHSIRQRVKKVEERLALGIIYRDTKAPKRFIRALELHPSLQQQNPNVMSLGQYLSSLRINPLENDHGGSSLPRFVERELEVTIASILLKNFGPRLGGALLPMLGISTIDSWITTLSMKIATFIASRILVEVSYKWEEDPKLAIQDWAVFPFAVSEIVSFLNLNQKFRSNPPVEKKKKTNNKNNNNDDDQRSRQQQEKSNVSTSETQNLSSLTWMSHGEIGYNPSYASDRIVDVMENDKTTRDAIPTTTTTDEETVPRLPLLPNPFVVKDHFYKAIYGMEEEILQTQKSSPTTSGNTTTKPIIYDPHDRSLPEPVPINERVLPGLHMGWGDAKCTHTKREILRNRLLAVLLTKLSYNYSLVEQGSSSSLGEGSSVKEEESLFIVEYQDVKCRFPDEFVQVLMTDHTIEVCPRTTITTFGIAACVKKADNKWKNIPLGFFFRTGYESSDGIPAYFSALHGGLDLSITSGPLLGQEDDADGGGGGGRLDIQFYVAIEGLCAWHSNHNTDVPWLKAVSTTEVYGREHTIQAVRLAGLLSTTFNSLATEMGLPFGGYGVLGVCNDSAAFIDYALRGETNLYPLISTGRFLFYCAHRLKMLEGAFSSDPSMANVVSDLRLLLKAACTLESDIHNSPGQSIQATHRYLVTNPHSYFQLTEDSKNVMRDIANTYREYSKGGSENNNFE